MNINDYKLSCIKFAEDTKDWGGLNPYSVYVATPNGEWAESCDNHENGIPLAWAFDVPTEYINACVNSYYATEFAEEYNTGIDDGWSEDQFIALGDKYEDCVANRESHVFCGLWDYIAAMMDDELREQLHKELSPCNNQKFFTAYEDAHEKKFGEEWELSKSNPVF